jgi:hypothetical protein
LRTATAPATGRCAEARQRPCVACCPGTAAAATKPHRCSKPAAVAARARQGWLAGTPMQHPLRSAAFPSPAAACQVPHLQHLPQVQPLQGRR